MVSKIDLAEAMRAFEESGKKVTQVPEGGKSDTARANELVRGCKCGCEGNYTDHSMRQGEGRFRDQY